MRDWSKSSLKSVLEGCSWQWALTHVYGLKDEGSPATVMGRAFHAALEHYEKSMRTATMDELIKHSLGVFGEDARALPVERWQLHDITPDEVVEQLCESIRIWWEVPCRTEDGDGPTLKELTDSRKLIAVEPYFKVPIKNSDSHLHGYMDAIHQDEQGIVVTDYKTASSFRRWQFNQPDSIEAAVYLHGVSEYKSDLPVRFEWQVVSAKEGKSRLIKGPEAGRKQAKIVTDAVKKADVIYELDAYRQRPDWNLCSQRWCPFYQGCLVTGELSPSYLTISKKPDTLEVLAH